MSETIRSFRGADAKAAFAAVKAAMGADAVILSAREIPGGLLRKPEVEVLAMAGSAAAPRPAEAPPHRPAALAQPSLRPAAPAAAGHLRLHPGEAPAAAPLRQPQQPGSNVAHLDRPASRREPLVQASPPADRALAGEVLALRRTVEEARREMMQLSQRTRSEIELHLRPAAGEIYNRLLNGGMEDGLAEEVLRQTLAKAVEGASSRALFDASVRLIGQRLVPGRAPWLPGARRAIALVGPTGVGKTTTIAKIAARALLDTRLRVALITVDTYRVGASEQLLRYGEIMGLPSHIARTEQELARAMGRCRDADLILIDTAGRSTHEAVAQQAELLGSLPGIQLQLVVSAATGWRDLAAVAERYRPLRPQGLILSKLDEAAAPASVISAAVRLSCPITCIADGQKVPDDLHAASAPELLRRAMAASEMPLNLRANA